MADLVTVALAMVHLDLMIPSTPVMRGAVTLHLVTGMVMATDGDHLSIMDITHTLDTTIEDTLITETDITLIIIMEM